MRIQHNIMAMNSYRNLGINNGALSKNLEKLSSGYRINRAGDDAAGLAISEKMRAQISGLDQAQKNAQSGINLVKTAEGALTEVHDMLNRMTTLATQSANGTYTDTDRAKIQAEVNALSEEIDRIANNSNFNGQKLLNGDLKGSTTVGVDAVKAQAFADIAAADKVDGKTPTAATKAVVSFKTTATGAAATTVTGLSGAISSTTTAAALGAMTYAGSTLKDLFVLQVNGATTAWTDSTAFGAAANTITLTAKTAGELKTAVDTDIKTGTGVTYTAGQAEGAGTAATSAKYKLDFDFTKLADGQTFKIGNETFEISTDGDVNTTGNTIIDLSGIDLTIAGTANTAGQYKAATVIRTAINGKLSGSFTVDAAPAAAPTGNKYTINLTALTAGDAGNLGAVRVSESATGAIGGTYTAGQAAGPAQAGTFASVKIDGFDLSGLVAGDQLTIGGKTLKVVANDAASVDANAGELKQQDVSAANVAAMFERLGFDKGKLNFNGTKLEVTDKTVGRTAQQLYNDLGITFAPNTAATTTSSGGLTLQIGADKVETINVRVASMKAADLGVANLNISSVSAANTAIDTIKSAIEKVSVQRGDLGAIQNRLEHTINNLGVMEENIQDAESTIRDTDIAEEMMAYTKNNILIQSAQAMLAQANQVPQGVLQLMG